jgi:hypothetical protein
MADRFPPPPMKVTKVEIWGHPNVHISALLQSLSIYECPQEELDAARVPYAWRDYCAHLLIPLNDCRRVP